MPIPMAIASAGPVGTVNGKVEEISMRHINVLGRDRAEESTRWTNHAIKRLETTLESY